MALPQLNTPTFELELPSSKEKIKYRPFLVKEQKILMMAQETGKNRDMLLSVCDIIKSCTFGKIKDPEELSSFDLEYIFLHIRGKSVGETFKINALMPDDKETYVPIEINLNDIKMNIEKMSDGNIPLTDDIGITMRYPRVKDMMDMNEDDGAVKISMDIIEKTIVNIYDKEEVHEEFSKDELTNFIDQLNSEQFEKIQEFYDTAPKLSHKMKVTNPKTQVENDVVIEGLQSFLG